MKKLCVSTVLLLSTILAFAQTHLYESISFNQGGEIHQCAFSPTVATINGNSYTSFPGFGMSNSTAAYGNHTHSGIYEPFITKSLGFLKWNGTAWTFANSAFVTSVSATLPVVSSGGATPVISMARADWVTDGYLNKDDFTTFYERVASVTANNPLQCTGGSNPELQILRATSIQNGYLHKDDFNAFSTRSSATTNGYLHADDFSRFNKLVSSQWEDNANGIDYTGGKVGIMVKTPAYGLDMEGTLMVKDLKSYMSYSTQLSAFSGVATMSGIWSDANTPISGSNLFNHSVVANANTGSYLSYWDFTHNYNYTVGIFDASGTPKAFCGIPGGAGGYNINLGSITSPWGSLYSSGISNTGNILTTGNLGIGTSSPSSSISVESATSATNVNLQSTYPIQLGTNTQTVAQINLSHISNSNAYARLVLRYDRDNSRYEFLQTLFAYGSTRAFQYVNMLTGGYEMRSGITDATFYNTGITSFGSWGGNIGAGTASPQAKLHVSTLALSTDLFKATNNRGAGTDSSAVINPRGFIGIGTTNPSNQLHTLSLIGGSSIMVEGTWVPDSQKSLGAIYFKNSATGDYGGMIMRKQAGPSNEFIFTTYRASNGTWSEFIFFDQYAQKLTLGRSSAQTVLQPVSGNVGIGCTDPTARLDISGDGIRVRTTRTPASATASGNQGEICWDANYVYICVSANVWKRSAITSW